MSSFASGSERRGKDRIDLNRRIQLRFDKFQDFLTEIAGNISPGGMFVRSDDPQEAGERFEFECSLADGYPLVSGRAEVVWVRRRAVSDEKPSGMGVRFLELRDKSELLIRKIVAQRIEAGERTFELEGERLEITTEEPAARPDLSEEILAASERLVPHRPGTGSRKASPEDVVNETPVEEPAEWKDDAIFETVEASETQLGPAGAEIGGLDVASESGTGREPTAEAPQSTPPFPWSSDAAGSEFPPRPGSEAPKPAPAPPKPPVAEPPVAKPPVAKPPVAEPPVAKPPVAKPPVAKPPVAEPPVAKPPVAKPPVAKPPVVVPPVVVPPVAKPPVAKPPVAKPSVAKPPVVVPPVAKPPVPKPPVPPQPSAPSPPTPARPAAPRASASSPSPPAVATSAAPGASAAQVPKPGSDSLGRQAAARSQHRRLGIRRFFELTLFSTVVGGFIVLVFNQYWVRPRIDHLEARLDELTGSSRIGGPPGFARAVEKDSADLPQEQEPVADAGAEVGVEVAGVATTSVAPEIAVPAEAPRPTVQEAVLAWASAWSEQRVEDYLSYYAEDFAPLSGAPRSEWEERRRERLMAQGAIRVAVVSLQVEEVSPNEARVMFTQSYQSDAYRDRVRKALRMSWIDGRWKIAEETVIRQLPW